MEMVNVDALDVPKLFEHTVADEKGKFGCSSGEAF